MSKISNKKKYLGAAILVTALAFTVTQATAAKQGNWGGQRGACQAQQLDPVTQKAYDKLFSETTDLRKQMAEKRAAMRAIMSADQPDAEAASKLAGELFELREQFRVKAQEYGLPIQGMGRGGLATNTGFKGDRWGKGQRGGAAN